MLPSILKPRKLKTWSQVFFIHIMKTAGTSFRRSLLNRLNDAVYPNTYDLERNRNMWYLNSHDFREQVRDGSLNLLKKKVICGHYSYEVIKEIAFEQSEQPFLATFLRHPVDRTVSMIHHRKRRFPELCELSIHEMLEDSHWVDQQITNYQTKIFAISDLVLPSVNVPYLVDESAYQLAVKRLQSMNFVGITENFRSSIRLFNQKTKIGLQSSFKENAASYPSLTRSERASILKLVEFDIEFYELAKKLFTKELSKN